MATSKGKNKGPGRRAFLQTVAVAGAIPAVELKSQGARPASYTASGRSKADAVEFPRKFTGSKLKMIAFPLGGVGAGSISLGGRGQFRDWEVFNRPDKGKSPSYSFASIWVKQGNRKPFTSVLESRILPPYEGSSGLGSANLPGMPRLASATFTGEFPMARIDFADEALSVKVSLEAFSPFIPLDAEESGLPVAILRYKVTNPGAVKAEVAVAFSLDNPVGKEGRANEFKTGEGLQGLFMNNPFLSATDPLAGSFAVSAIAGTDAKVTYLRGWRAGTGWLVGPLLFWDDFSADGELGPEPTPRSPVGSLCIKQTIAPKAEQEFTFLLSWHFPNRTPERSGWSAPKGDEKTVIGNHYSTRFKDAWAAAEHTAAKLPELEKKTRQFVTALRESTIPDAVKDAASANLSTLVVPTSFRTADGAFHGFEGSNDQSGCCFGNCTHVWNYEVATPHLFPSLARSLRGAAFGYCTDEIGHQSFRQKLPDGKERFGTAAADGQMGQVMHAYLDWQVSGDTAWLQSIWPATKRALEFAWIPGGWDANKDGVMEGVQHNTYDVEFYGPNPLCGIWYLGALRAGEEMARAVGDNDSAKEYRRLFESGSTWIDGNLFNGEFYIQKVQPWPKDKIAKGLTAGMGAADPEHPIFQVGEGCLLDQLLGQYMADIAGLGNLVDKAHIGKTLDSIYKYNYKRSLYQHESVQRTYVLNDEPAVVVCDYAGRPRPEIPFPYFAEAWTGLEYIAASLMIYLGMVERGVEFVENVRRRYDGERRNPWDEPECGHHYARAMSSWAGILAVSGFHYNGPKKEVSVKPRAGGETFRSIWNTALGWGSFQHSTSATARQLRLTVIAGSLPVTSVELGWQPKTATLGKKTVAVEAKGKVASFSDPLIVSPGADLVISG